MKKLSIAIAVTLVIAFPLSSPVEGQRSAQPAPGAAPLGDVVVGSGNYSPIVSDLDKAIEFYGDLLGLTAGSTVVSAGGVPATLQGGIRAAIMPDTDGLYFVLIQAAPPRPEQPR